MLIDLLNRDIKYIIFFPLLMSYLLKGKNVRKVRDDLDSALRLCPWHSSLNRTKAFMNYICFLPEWRTLYLFRLKKVGKVLSFFYPNHLLLFIRCSQIEGGLFIQHGHSTRIECKSIGKNCQIWHNVTIGKKYSGGEFPTIGNNVKISTGACVLGDIRIGNNVTIGANAVVLKDIPDNCIAVGVPAKIISKDNSQY